MVVNMAYLYYGYYRCDECGTEWRHKWDQDYNNDYTTCPKCPSYDFEEISEDEYTGEITT
jgi:DNA-directed RNA polymerase subunit RPC12/RpoP